MLRTVQLTRKQVPFLLLHLLSPSGLELFFLFRRDTRLVERVEDTQLGCLLRKRFGLTDRNGSVQLMVEGWLRPQRSGHL